MIPQVGQKIKILDLPAYKQKFKPKLPCTGIVTNAYPFTFLVEIEGKVFELYDDNSFAIITTI